MFDSVFGLPFHPLIVHATVVIVPAAALMVGLSAVHARFRAWAGPVPLLASAAGLVLAPLSTSSGESLRSRLPDTALIDQHAELADTLLWFMIGLTICAAGLYLLPRWRPTGRGLSVAIAVASVVASAATLVDVGLIGHSGAKAAWADTPSASSGGQSGDAHG